MMPWEQTSDEMIQAIEVEDLVWMRKLLRRGYGVDTLSPTQFADITPLYRACQVSSIEAAEVLLDAGANIDFQTIFGRTALHMAIEVRDNDLLQFLIDRGARVDMPDGDGATALRVAINDENVEAVKMLTKAGANPVLVPDDAPAGFCTPFHASIAISAIKAKRSPVYSREQVEIISHLVLECGMDPAPVGKPTRMAQAMPIEDLLRANAEARALLSSLQTELGVRGAMSANEAPTRSPSHAAGPL